MERIEPYVNGVPVSEIGAYGDVEYSENWRRGCDAASWAMNAWTRHDELQAGSIVQLRSGPTPRWTGLLSQPGTDGTFQAYGMAAAGDGVKPIDGGGAPTRDPQTAVVQAITRGAVPWAGRSSGVPLGTGTPIPGDVEATTTLTQLLDQHSDYTGWEWRVDHRGQITDSTWPTSPSWAVQVNRELWTLSDRDYVTHLNVTFLDATPSFQTFSRSAAASTAAAAKWRRVEKDLDLTGLGILTLAQAQQTADQVLAKTGPRMVLDDPIVVGPGQLKNLGDVPAGWTSVHAGMMVRLWGVPDRSLATPTLHTDVTIGRIECTRSTLTMTPVGAEVQTFEDVIAELFTAGA